MDHSRDPDDSKAERETERASTFAWLLRLRWLAIAGQLGTIAVVRWALGIEIVLWPLLTVVAIEALTNVVVSQGLRAGSVTDTRLGSLIAVDVLILAALLYFSGGAQNPFSFLFLVQIALGAMVLPWRWTWGLVALALGCLAGLYFDSVPLPMTHGQMMRLHLYGMWVASGVAGAFIVTFVGRVSGELRESRSRASQERTRAERTQRLASLATLAAGAAHELATPLGTIALVADELERQVLARAGSEHLLEDVRLVRSQVARCRAVLDELSAEAARSPGEAPEWLALSELLERAEARVQVRVERDGANELEPARIRGQRRAMERALDALLDNARDASPEGAEVRLRVSMTNEHLRIEVEDSGDGMDEATLARVGEPFFTTKETGRGMGLGVLLARTVIEEAGGSLSYQSRLGEGTSARIELPLAERA